MLDYVEWNPAVIETEKREKDIIGEESLLRSAFLFDLFIERGSDPVSSWGFFGFVHQASNVYQGFFDERSVCAGPPLRSTTPLVAKSLRTSAQRRGVSRRGC